MKTHKLLSILLMTVLLTGCSTPKFLKQGHMASKSFYYKTNFSTIKTLIVLPVEINGINRNFLFDTGAEVTLLQRDTTKGKIEKINGSTNRKTNVGSETIQSMKIGTVEFVDTYAMNANLIGLKEQVPNFGGLIGQPMISKANWLIDYPNKSIEISDKHLIDSTYKPIEIRQKKGASYITLIINGAKYPALIDLGSSSALAIPENSELAKQMLEKYDFQENEREIYSIGGLQKTKEKVGSIKNIYLDDIEFKNVKATIRHTSEIRIGNDFFKDYIVYIDNSNSNYSLKKTN